MLQEGEGAEVPHMLRRVGREGAPLPPEQGCSVRKMHSSSSYSESTEPAAPWSTQRQMKRRCVVQILKGPQISHGYGYFQ